MTNEELITAINLVRAGDKNAALPILKKIVVEEQDNEKAWIWLSDCLEAREQKIYCLQQAYRINPYNSMAHAALEKLNAPPMATSQPEAAPKTPAPLSPRQQDVVPSQAEADPTVSPQPVSAPIPPAQTPAASQPEPVQPAAGPDPDKWEVDQVTISFGLTGPKKNEIRDAVYEHVRQGWTYLYHDLDAPLAAKAMNYIFRPNLILSPIRNIMSKTQLAFGRNKSIPPQDQVDYPFAIKNRILPGEGHWFNPKRRKYFFKSIHGNILAHTVAVLDKKATGYDRVVTLYEDEDYRQRLAECRDSHLYLYPDGVEQLAATVKSGKKNEVIVTTPDGREFITLLSMQPQAVVYSIPWGMLALTVEGEVFRQGGLTKLPEGEERLILLWSAVCWRTQVSTVMDLWATKRRYKPIPVID